MVLSQTIDKEIKQFIHKLKCQKVKMLCLSLYCLLCTGCGKEVKNSGQADSSNRSPALSSSSIKLNNANSEYTMRTFGDIYIPSSLEYISGNINEKVKVYYAKDTDVEELYCLYKNDGVSEDKLFLDDCYTETDYDEDGFHDNLNYSSGYSIILIEGQKISLEAQNIIVEGEFEVEWR